MQFASEESPSGMLARSGSYAVKSRLIDDDKQVWLDFEWGELVHSGHGRMKLTTRIQARQGVVDTLHAGRLLRDDEGWAYDF
jgi:hypothetical protein